MGRLDGKVAIISGGARGQGAAEARLFAREGAKVVLGDVLDTEGMRVEAEVRKSGGDATYVHLDVTIESDWVAAVEAAISSYGKLNVLVNNAGIFTRVSIEQTSREDWDRMMAINTTGVFLGTKHTIPAMREAGGGSIVNISSTAGLVGTTTGSATYVATKGAVRLFSKAVALQHASDGIRCNTVCPGPIDTPMVQDYLDDPVMREAYLQQIPLHRIGVPEDVAYGVLFLASDESSYITGTELVIDGGRTAE